jgi:hypothetical protein
LAGKISRRDVAVARAAFVVCGSGGARAAFVVRFGVDGGGNGPPSSSLDPPWFSFQTSVHQMLPRLDYAFVRNSVVISNHLCFNFGN